MFLELQFLARYKYYERRVSLKQKRSNVLISGVIFPFIFSSWYSMTPLPYFQFHKSSRWLDFPWLRICKLRSIIFYVCRLSSMSLSVSYGNQDTSLISLWKTKALGAHEFFGEFSTMTISHRQYLLQSIFCPFDSIPGQFQYNEMVRSYTSTTRTSRMMGKPPFFRDPRCDLKWPHSKHQSEVRVTARLLNGARKIYVP